MMENNTQLEQLKVTINGKFIFLTLLLVLLYSTILFAQNVVYINPENDGDPNEDGSYDHPFDSWEDTYNNIESNTTYLQKRGTVDYSSYNRIYQKNNIYIGAYGSGTTLPIILSDGIAGSPAENIFRIEESTNITIDSLSLKGEISAAGSISLEACIYVEGANGTANWNNNIIISNCELSYSGDGYTSLPYDTGTDTLLIENCHVHHTTGEGLWGKTSNPTVRNCYIHDINLNWHYRGHTHTLSGGDGIQLSPLERDGNNGTAIYEYNIIDRRGTGNKFCLIHNSVSEHPGRNIIIRYNTFYPPKDTADDQGGTTLYLDKFDTAWIYGNKFIGRGYDAASKAYGIGWINATEAHYFYYNLCDSVTGFHSTNSYGGDTEDIGIKNNTFVNIPDNGNNLISVLNNDVDLENNIFALNEGASFGNPQADSSNNLTKYGNQSDWNSYFGFADWENGNYSITSGSNSHDAGLNYSEFPENFNYDMLGVSTPQGLTRDVGACEVDEGGASNLPPQISNQNFNIEENSSNGQQVGTILASDPDNGQLLTYQILSGNTNSAFQIGSGTGILSVANSSALNFEIFPQFALTIKVTDNGAGNLTAQAVVTVNVNDVNESPNISNQNFNIDENSSNGQQVGIIQASDPDNGQSMTYQILSGNTNSTFQIASGTGILSVANSSTLNFEIISQFALTIMVTDNGPGNLTDQAVVTVHINDVNEVPNVNNQSFSIDENSSNGQLVGTIQATDPDNGQSLSYQILSGNTNSAFQITSGTGILSVSNSSVLDFETLSQFSLTIQVTDNGTGSLSDQAVATVNINNVNEIPAINDQVFNIDENSSNGQQVGTVEATDPDDGQSLSYQILAGNSNSAFQIASGTGLISVANSSVLDFETLSQFALTIQVTDNGTGNLTNQAIVTVNVNDVNEAPEIINVAFSIDPFMPDGTEVGQVIASDPDNGQTITFEIINGNTDNAFSINSMTGLITVANSNILDPTINPTFSLTVKVTDNGAGSLFSQGIVTLTFDETNTHPEMDDQAFSLAENAENGQQVAMIIAFDPDAGQNLNYSIISGNTDGAFNINSITGKLTVANSIALDFETNSEFVLLVEVEDDGIGNLSAQANITVQLFDVNETPQIENQTYLLDENSYNGYDLGIVEADDPDAGQSLTYSIVSGNTGSAFYLQPTTGMLTVLNNSLLDFETNPEFNLLIEVEDNGPDNLTAQATVIVQLTDVNEEPQIQDQSFSLEENSVIGYELGNVMASDPDIGQSVVFTIVSGNTGSTFYLDPNTGLLYIINNSNLDFETTPEFNLLVEATDNGQGNLSDEAIVTITVTDVNEAPQVEDLVFEIDAFMPNGSEVGQVIASDPDMGQVLTFELIDGNIDNAFSINSESGLLSVANSSVLNPNLYPTFTLTVEVTDNGVGNLSSQGTIILSFNETNQQPQMEDQLFTVAENTQVGQQVGWVIAIDPDAGQSLSYTILSGNEVDAFQMNSETGELTVWNSNVLNFELITEFVLLVEVEDDGLGNLTDQAYVTLQLTDVNETPVIVDQTFLLEENSNNGIEVGNILASDPDAGQSLTYTIVSGNTDNAFYLEAATGMLTVSNSAILDYEVTPELYLQIEVEDNGEGNLSNQATITISLIDIYDPPVGMNTVYTTNVEIEFDLFPNPATDDLNVSLSNLKWGSYTMRIIDLTGNVVLEKEYKAISPELNEKIDVSNFANGLYFVNVSNSSTVKQAKFVKL